MTNPDRLSVNDIEDIASGRGHFSLVERNLAKRLADTMRENEILRGALANARHIMRVENLLESWAENTKIIDDALSYKESEHG